MPVLTRSSLEASPLDRYLSYRRANGSETITWRASRSTVRLLPADGDAARSAKSHLAVIDEARELTEDQGEAIEAGGTPPSPVDPADINQ